MSTPDQRPSQNLEEHKLVVPFEQRFGNLQPENAAACIMLALIRYHDSRSAYSRAEMAEIHPWHSQDQIEQLNTIRAELNRNDIAKIDALKHIGVMSGKDVQSVRYDTTGGEALKGLIIEATESLIKSHGNYEFLRDLVEREIVKRPGGPLPRGVNLSGAQRKFLREWDNHYIGIPSKNRAS